ncbi:glycosyltransferase family 4 protein [Frigoribacterium faeni]|uniref:Glycosyl transferase n=1 Tax=Frigoribacterium faeni TaxID=145483 RepID=A0A7W3JJM2_9MICO|nr:glycosyltransferase involved in cell wall biosynthesis [Frigoribacterium faeni]BFF16119.1 glycosyltransferase [Microbacterium flavescens]GEK82681.1 glycosyl transferase [Frigoribacterium faeni]
MRVLLDAAIFGLPDDFRARNLQESGESLLLDGLLRAGVDATPVAPALHNSWRGYDVVHLNHLTRSCVRLLAPTRSRVVFTRHKTEAPSSRRQQRVLEGAYRHSDALVVMSETERELVPSSVDRDRLHVIANGVEQSHFPARPRRRPADGRPWRLLSVGQLIDLKRVDLTVRLVADLRRAGVRVELDVVSQRETLRPELERLAVELGVADAIRFVGPATRVELGQRMLDAHFLVLASRTEAQPTVVTEAGFSALPVISFRVGGVVEQLPAAHPLLEVPDVRGLLPLTLDLMRDYERVSEAFAENAGPLRERFSIERMVAAHLDLYARLLG